MQYFRIITIIMIISIMILGPGYANTPECEEVSVSLDNAPYWIKICSVEFFSESGQPVVTYLHIVLEKDPNEFSLSGPNVEYEATYEVLSGNSPGCTVEKSLWNYQYTLGFHFSAYQAEYSNYPFHHYGEFFPREPILVSVNCTKLVSTNDSIEPVATASFAFRIDYWKQTVIPVSEAELPVKHSGS